MAYRGSEKDRATRAVWRQRNREEIRAKQRASYAANPEQWRAKRRRAEGVVNPTGDTKAGPCEICESHCDLVLDHDHATGKVRGWLCDACNKGLGHFKDDSARLQRASTYIEKSKTL